MVPLARLSEAYKTPLLAPRFLPNIPHILWCFSKPRMEKGCVRRSSFFQNMKAAIVMCALCFGFFQNHAGKHYFALSASASSKTPVVHFNVEVERCEKQNTATSITWTRDLFRWLDTQRSIAGHYARDRTWEMYKYLLLLSWFLVL